MREQGLTYVAIANKLNADGVPNTKRGGKWHPTTVYRVLHGNQKNKKARRRSAFLIIMAELAKGSSHETISARLEKEGMNLGPNTKWIHIDVANALLYPIPENSIARLRAARQFIETCRENDRFCYKAIAEQLNHMKLMAPHGGKWTGAVVQVYHENLPPHRPFMVCMDIKAALNGELSDKALVHIFQEIAPDHTWTEDMVRSL